MRDYELTVLAKSDDTKSVKEILSKAGAKVKSKSDPQKKPMAYEIRGSNEAFYAFFELEVDPAQVSELDSKLRLQDDLIRFLLVKKN